MHGALGVHVVNRDEAVVVVYDAARWERRGVLCVYAEAIAVPEGLGYGWARVEGGLRAARGRHCRFLGRRRRLFL